jgi:hypothetical protein
VLDNGSLKIMYYRARYYDPETGRFMQRDPLEYISGTSLYEYVNSNPKSFLDPFGFYPWDMPGQEPFWNIETCTCYCGWAVVTSKAPLALEGCLRECYAYDAMKGDSPDHPDPHFNPMPGFDPITTVNQCHDKFRDHCKQKRKPAPPGPPSTPPVVPPTPPEPPVVIPPELPPIILPPPPPPAETWQECVDRVRAERNEERRNRCADLPTRPRRKCIEEVDREYRDKAKTECGPLKKGSSISKHSGIGIIREINMAIFCIFWALGCSVNLPDLDQPLIVGPISAVSERGDIAFSIGPPSKASNRIPSPSESYTVIVQPLGQIYLVKESKGTQALGWRNHVNKSSLTVAVSSSDPNSNIWIEVEPSDNGSYQIVSHALPYDLLPYAVSWSPDGNILALAAIRWASDERLIGLITDEFETSMRVYFCASPKGLSGEITMLSGRGPTM